ncbi:MAG TPA: LysR family transcriptional regulator, partial [Isosphaeraceae bacterium]|nr:LysR family transcriptional regulator [Isosphaeraceae bacterium]
MDLTLLRHFLKIIERGSLTRAAEECGLSQPALSQQVARLEKVIGRPVFDRQGRELRLTEAGRLLEERAQQLLTLWDNTTEELLDDDGTGRVVIAAIPTIAPYFLPPFLTRFRQLRPRAVVEVHEEVTENLVRRCSRGEIDIGILALPLETRDLTIEPLFDEELLLVLPAAHPLASRVIVRSEEIRNHPFVLLDEAHCLTGRIENFCKQQALQPLATGRTHQLSTVQELVALGHGISFIPEMARRLDQDPRRAYRSLASPALYRTIAACWNPRRY